MAEWCDFATRRDGPPSKFGGYAAGNSSPKRGEVKHSMVGSYGGALSVLDNLSVPSSWHFSVLKDGSIVQHYPLSANCWHGNDSDNDGEVRANIDLIGVEHEGGGPGNESEPLTDAQLLATIQLTRWAAEQFSLTRFARFPEQWDVWTLAEHNQVGNSPTACPSRRIPWDAVLRGLNPAPPAYGAHDIGALGEFLRAAATKYRLVWADEANRLVEVVDEYLQPMQPRHYFYV